MINERVGGGRRTGARITGWYDAAWVRRHFMGSPRDGVRRGVPYVLTGGPLAGDPVELRERHGRLWLAATLRAGRIIVQQGAGDAPEELPEPALYLGSYAYDSHRDAVCWQDVTATSAS